MAIKVCTLASSSKGNCTYVETLDQKILIDLGVPLTYIKSNLEEIGVSLTDITSVLITHTHTDHIYSLKSFNKRYNANIYMTEKMEKELDIDIKNIVYINDTISIGKTIIEPFKLSHDRNDINGYVITCNNKSLVYITDTGYINIKSHNTLYNHEIYVIESNHDVQMLMNCNRPYYEKMRVLGDKGHLSNEACAKYLKDLTGEKTKQVILIHLSEDNNTPSLACSTVSGKIKKGIDITVAKAKEKGELIEV